MKQCKKAGYFLLGLILLFVTVFVYTDNNERKSSKNNKMEFMLAEFDKDVNLEQQQGLINQKLNEQNIYALNVNAKDRNKLISSLNSKLMEEDATTHLLCLDENCQICDCHDCVNQNGDCTSKDDCKEDICHNNKSCDSFNDLQQTENKLSWNISSIKADFLWEKGLSGKGIKVALFDTGIDLNNKNLRVAGGVSFIEGTDSYTDDNGHGTEMAGILAAQMDQSGVQGIAPEAELYSVKVLDKNGVGKYSDIIQGIEWAIDHHMNIITLSLGGSKYSKILNDEINKAVQNNILFIAAAGNGGNDEIMYPAAYPQVICVGASDKNQQIAAFSNYGDNVDILAPGTEINTVGLDNHTMTVDGTSASVQHVVGVAALLWSADEKLGGNAVRSLLLAHSDSISDIAVNHNLNAKLAYTALQQGDYSTKAPEVDLVQFDNLQDVGIEGIVYAQACSHNYSLSYQTSPTCTMSGATVYVCTKCGASKTTTTPALGHSSKTTTTPATCTSDGKKVTTCSRCGTTLSSSTITKLGHDPTSDTTPATCTKDGKTVVSCTRCGVTLSTKTLSKLGHDGTTSITPATCTKDGTTKVVCARCGVTISIDTNNPPALGHSWKLTSQTAATCVVNGSKNYTCTRCGATRSDPIIGEHFYNTYTVQPTCTSNGYTEQICKNCGTVTGYQVIYCPGHNFTYSESSYHTPGLGHYYCNSCTRCGQNAYSGYDNSCYTTTGAHTSSGHLIQTICSYCGIVVESHYATIPTCLSCTTTPSVCFSNLTGNSVLTEADTNFLPQIKVSDEESDSIVCSYYLDGSTTSAGTITVSSTKTGALASFTTSFDVRTLTEGSHTVKVTAKDPLATSLGQASVTFLVDKSAPVISKVTPITSTTDLTLQVEASDSQSGLADMAYRYTLTGVSATDWMSSASCPFTGLLPNSSYDYQVEVKDRSGHIATYSGTATTGIDTPAITLTALSENGVLVQKNDTNPVNTQYSISVSKGSTFVGYLDMTGALTDTPSSFAFSSLTATGLSANTAYTFLVSAQNAQSGTALDSTAYITTSPDIPSGITVAAVSSSAIKLTWDSSGGAESYEITREVIDNNGSIVYTDLINTDSSTNYLDNAVAPDQTYRYKIRSKDSRGLYSAWSNYAEIITLPNPPAKVNLKAPEVEGSLLKLSWDVIDDAVGYLTEIHYDGKVKELYSSDNHVSFDTEIYNCQCSVTVKAYNVCSVSDPQNTKLWSNAGEASDELIIQTNADVPTLKEINQNMITQNSVEISWTTKQNPDSVSNIIGVYKDGELLKEINAGAADNYVVTGLEPLTTYTFKIKARNSYQVETQWSEGISATTLMDYPGVPTGVIATSKAGYIILTWSPSVNAETYQIERDGVIIASNLTGNTFKDDKVTPDTMYSYRLKAINATGESSWSLPLEKKSLGNLPDTPSITSVSGSSISMKVEWSAVEGAAGYDIEVDGKVNNMGLATSYEHNGLLPGSDHSYRVRSRNNFGKSDWSVPYSVSTPQIIPDIPTIISVDSTDSKMLIKWTSVYGADHYTVNIDGTDYDGIFASEYLFTVTGDVVAGSTHSIQVKAVNDEGSSEWSSVYSATLTSVVGDAVITEPIPVVPELSIATTGSAIIVLSWNTVQDAAYYQLEADGNVVYTGTDTTFIHSGLTENSPHQYRVLAGNSSGVSDWSTPIDAVTAFNETPTPENLNYHRINDNTTAITWNNAIGATGYRIEINGQVQDEIVVDTSININTIAGTVYNIRVASIFKDGETETLDWSDELTFRSFGKLPEAGVISATSVSSDAITVTWNEVSSANGYELEADGVIHNTGNATSFVLTGYLPSSSHTFRVRAYNETGEGEWSESKTAMTDSGIPGVPINITGGPIAAVSTATGAAISIQWDPLEGASSYEVEDMNGTIYTTDTNSITIENLIPGIKYDFRVRAAHGEESGAWSSRISFTPVITVPTHVKTSVVEGGVSISWDAVGGAQKYEIEMDGVVIANTKDTSIIFDSNMFFMCREIRVRACYEDQYSEWSAMTVFDQPQMVSTDAEEGEELTVLLPAENVDIKKYQLSLSFDTSELELVDACEMTQESEVTTTYIDGINTYVFINTEGSVTTLTFVVDNGDETNWSGLAAGIKLRSKISGKVTLQYGVTLR